MADDDFQCCAGGTHEAKGKPMSEQAQVGDTVRLTINWSEEGIVEKWPTGRLHVHGNALDISGRTVEILSRATPPLPSEPGTFWLDCDGDLWKVSNDGKLLFNSLSIRPELFAPFHQLVLK